MTSPSRMKRSPLNSRAAAVSSGSRSVMSSRVRVYSRTVSPSRWTWTRMPSSFSSTAHAPSLSTASDTEVAVCASIGRTGRPTVSRKRARDSGPSARSARATSWREPASITARRTSAGGAPVAWARPSTATASSAPCLTSPVISPNRKRCSSSVAAPINSPTRRARSACEPVPDTLPSSVRRASTSRTVRVGSAAGGTGRLSAFQPMPSRPWGRRPARYGMTIGASSASASRKSSASRAIFRERAEVAATSWDTWASRVSSMQPSCDALRWFTPR